MNTTTSHYVEVTLPNGTICTKRGEWTHAIVTEDAVVSWHGDVANAHRAWYRKATRRELPPMVIVQARVAIAR